MAMSALDATRPPRSPLLLFRFLRGPMRRFAPRPAACASR
jgi:hypothetical protein